MKYSTLELVYLVDAVIITISGLVTCIYAPLAKSWPKALLAVFITACISTSLGMYEIKLAADGKQNILATILFPVTSLILAIFIRAIRLAIFPIHKKPNKTEG